MRDCFDGPSCEHGVACRLADDPRLRARRRQTFDELQGCLEPGSDLVTVTAMPGSLRSERLCFGRERGLVFGQKLRARLAESIAADLSRKVFRARERKQRNGAVGRVGGPQIKS
jgi:hypothetical protein